MNINCLFTPRRILPRILVVAALLSLGTLSTVASDKTTITFGGKQVACEVVNFQVGHNDEPQMKLRMSGVEQTLPVRVFSTDDVKKCYALNHDSKNAGLRLAMGGYFVGKELYNDAETELNEAVKLDAKLKDRADALLKKIAIARTPAKVPEPPKPPEKDKKTDPPPEVVKGGKDKSKGRIIKLPDGTIIEIPGSKSGNGYGDEEGGATMVVGGDGKPRMVVPPLTEAKMKEFLDKRLADLNAKIGGEWRLIRTKHYYCFSNIPKPKHEMIAKDWNEGLYTLLCDVLKHKEGDKLWNNKMPIYYFDTFKQFQKFAVTIDQSPGGQYSGGYFSSRGRDVHICIPFMKERYGTSPKMLDDSARNTLFHEGTHAFLQLAGEDVPLTRWLHEGMAQFIEFWYQDEKSPEKHDRVAALNQYVRANGNAPLAWSETDERPMGGTDLEGYAYAWAKLEFFFRNFNNQSLPQMIKLIKSGKTEKEAMETVFKMPTSRLEEGFKIWIKDAIKANFKFK